MEMNDLINALKNGDNVGADAAFKSMMGDRINSAMDARKIEIAQGMMRGEEQLDLDLDGEDEGVEEDESVSDDQETE